LFFVNAHEIWLPPVLHATASEFSVKGAAHRQADYALDGRMRCGCVLIPGDYAVSCEMHYTCVSYAAARERERSQRTARWAQPGQPLTQWHGLPSCIQQG